MSDPQDLVSIYRAANSIEAELVKNLMGEEGIEAMVTDANSALAGLEFSQPDVMVRVADETRAREFIAGYEETLIEHAEEDADDDSDEDDEFDEEDEDTSE